MVLTLIMIVVNYTFIVVLFVLLLTDIGECVGHTNTVQVHKQNLDSYTVKGNKAA